MQKHTHNLPHPPRHHLPDGRFTNNYTAAIRKPFSDMVRWKWEAPAVPLLSFPLATEAAEATKAADSPTLTWIGHATLLLQLGGVNILTDPHFGGRASPLPFFGPKRGTPPGLALFDLPLIDIVLLSHNHYDHLHKDSLKHIIRRHPQAQFFVPLGLGGIVRCLGGRHVVELDWGDSGECRGLQITAEPCQHWSRRGLFDGNKTLWASWVVESADMRFLFIGDTGYSRDFADLGEKYGGFDVAAIPIGAYQPRWFMREAHASPDEAVAICRDVRARFAVATHWGTFRLTDEPMDEPPRKLQQAMAAADVEARRFAVLRHGERRDLSFLHGGGTA